MKTCPRCGKRYKGHSAMSRVDGSEICSLCGSEEALNVVLEKGVISEDEKDSILKIIGEKG